MRKTKENGGITLVALVVTIVVLLILAGVSINLVLGENGIVTKAMESKYRQQVASILDVTANELSSIYLRKNEGEIIDDNQKLDIIYSKIEENNLTSNTKRIGSLVVVADKYVVSMTTGKEGELADSSKWNYYTLKNWKGYEDSDNTNWAFITGYKGTEKDITIPEYVLEDGTVYVIREIRQNWDGGFSNNTNIESITVSDNIMKIEQTEFADMKNLKKVIIADTVTSIANNVFANDYKLEYVKLPANLSKIENATFICCYALKDITIPNKVQSIGENAFGLCLYIEKVEIPSSVKNIGKNAFSYMGIDDSNEDTSAESSGDTEHTNQGYKKGKLKEIILHEGLETVEDSAFAMAATVQKDLRLPVSLKSVGTNAFSKFGKAGGGKVYNSDGSLYTEN